MRVVSQDHQIAETFNKYFRSIPFKNMAKNHECEGFDSSDEDPVSSIIKRYRSQPSIELIKTKNKSKTFRFREINTDEIKKFFEKLDLKKASQKFDMSTDIFKKMKLSFACNNVNALICSSKFDNELKESDIVPMHKKISKFSKENYILASIHLNISKDFERFSYDQICFLKESMWLSQGLQCTTLTTIYDRRMEKNGGLCRCLRCIINRLI